VSDGLRSLTSTASLDAATLWRYLQRLVERVGASLEGDASVEDCLDVVVELLGADRGLVVLEGADGSSLVRHGRAARKRLAVDEEREVCRTFVRQALESDSAVVWEASAQPIDSGSAHRLGIHAALVAPLPGRGAPRGVLYVDFRNPLKHVEPAHQEFFMAAVVLVGGMLDQSAAARTAREQLREAQSHYVEAQRPPALDELLAAPGLAHLRGEAAVALSGALPVLLQGESGSGKTLFAQALAEALGRRPIVRVVLGASDDLNTLTSELFGHERGAFSGATSRRVGLAEFADGGTLILDEVLNLPLRSQHLLLDFVQFGAYRPLGYTGAQPKHAAVRIIAATNGDLQAAVREGRFREDLYFRLAGATLRLPPLRRRREDIPALAEEALRRADPSRRWRLSPDARTSLGSSSHEWPGNMRELEWVVQRARVRALARDQAAFQIERVDVEAPASGPRGGPTVDALRRAHGEAPGDAWRRLQQVREELEASEKDVLREVLAHNDGVVAKAARELGVARTTLAGRAHALALLPPAKGS
jgi:transcriptional regulator with GAF, ATPase, and Fis domain